MSRHQRIIRDTGQHAAPPYGTSANDPDYEGRHRRPGAPETTGARFPEGLVYIGQHTGDCYRMGPRGTLAANLTRPWRR